MIWLDGDLADPARLSLPAADRIFEHGLGLFETFRTWDGRPLLLDRHLGRLRQSARALGIDLDGMPVPTAADVARLVASTDRGDALVRLTVSAGRPPDRRPTAWMTVGPLPPAADPGGWRVVDAAWTVAYADPLARHKTLNYWAQRIATEQAHAAGADEAVFGSADGRIWEGSRSNLFLILGRNLVTPPRSGPILPGIMRDLSLQLAGQADLIAIETDVTGATVAEAAAIFLTNSVRGVIPVASWADRAYRPTAAGRAQVARLTDLIAAHLTRERDRA